MWIMIAGPYRSGANSEADREQNLANLNRAAYELFRKGHVPVVGVNCALPTDSSRGIRRVRVDHDAALSGDGVKPWEERAEIVIGADERKRMKKWSFIGRGSG